MQLPLNLHLTAKSAVFFSQHQPKDNFHEERILNVSNLFEINETQVNVTTVYPGSRNVAIPTLHDKQSPLA